MRAVKRINHACTHFSYPSIPFSPNIGHQLANSCIDDSDWCPYIGEGTSDDDESLNGYALAFNTDPVPMIGGATYTVYLGIYCEELPCDTLDPDVMQPSNITITPWPCDATRAPTQIVSARGRSVG